LLLKFKDRRRGLAGEGGAILMSADSGLPILVVEDDRETALLIRLTLKGKFPNEVVIADDCASARGMLSGSTFALVTLDYRLPDGNGLELLSEVMSSASKPPAIMVTAYSDRKIADEASRLGAVGYIIKNRKLQSLLLKAATQALQTGEATNDSLEL
jgi:DNA-binding NtrC family response regulator